jgi:glycosyltransferase involved in cell wall biosynthesis
LRICQIMLGAGFGGAERYFVDLSRALAERGDDVLAICHAAGRAREQLQLQPQARLQVAALRVLGHWDPFAVRRVRTLIETHGAELVQAHLARAAHIAGRALDGTRVPLVAKTHNYVKLKYYRRVDLFVPTTADQRRHLLDAGVAAERCELIPNFSSQTPVPQPAAGDGRRVVAYGRFVPKKGFAVLLDAVARLRAAGVALQLALAGDGPLRAELERQTLQLGIDSVVQFRGWQQDVAPLFSAAELFVLPSLDEPFGIALLEAMAAGVPIVATDTQGPREILDDSCAWLVPPGDAAALAAAIDLALREPLERRRRAAAALRRFGERYSEQVVVTRLQEVYRRLAGISG